MTQAAAQLFESAVGYYARYWSGYPKEMVDALAARAGLDGTQRVLDIGCGTGQLTIPLARHAREVVAIDPVPDMLSGGRQAAEAAGVGNISWLEGDSSQISMTASSLTGCVPSAESGHGIWVQSSAAG